MAYTTPGETRERIYRFMKARLLAGQPPTVRDVQQEFGFRSDRSARTQLEALVAEGRLVKLAGKARGYRLPDREMPVEVPVLGGVQAGALHAAIEDPQGYLAVQSRFPSKELFALRVRGDSMIGAGILPDDVVIVRKQSTAESGEIVVAMIEDEATVKRLHIADGAVELHAENPRYAPIVPDSPDELAILGRVVEVRRYLDGSPQRNGS